MRSDYALKLPGSEGDEIYPSLIHFNPKHRLEF